MSAPQGEADDLKMLTGVGPVLEKKLNEMGIFHYHQIAALSSTELVGIDKTLGIKRDIKSDNWRMQAAKLGESLV